MHVRTYFGAQVFRRAIAHRVTPGAGPKMTSDTGFNDRTSARTRAMVDYGGFWLPQVFSGVGATEECWACREKPVVIICHPCARSGSQVRIPRR